MRIYDGLPDDGLPAFAEAEGDVLGTLDWLAIDQDRIDQDRIDQDRIDRLAEATGVVRSIVRYVR